MSTPSTTEYLVNGGFGLGFTATSGQFVTIVDLEGAQAGDFVAINQNNLKEGISSVRTRRHLRSLFFGIGDTLLSNYDNPMLKVVLDTIGVHDSTVPACDPTRYSVDFGVPGHRNCLENLHDGLLAHQEIDILDVPEPFNLFQNSPVAADGHTGVVNPPSKAGDRIVFEVLMDLVCALSPCPQDIIPGNGLCPTEMKAIVSNDIPENT
jgi:hypothetical protein